MSLTKFYKEEIKLLLESMENAKSELGNSYFDKFSCKDLDSLQNWITNPFNRLTSSEKAR